MKPTAPVVGQVYIDLETHNALMYTGSDWAKIAPMQPVPDTRTDKEKVWDALSKPVENYNNNDFTIEAWMHMAKIYTK
jgi:hypothetical protein